MIKIHNHKKINKELPRFKVQLEYEKEFKDAYIKTLGECFDEVFKTALKMIKK